MALFQYAEIAALLLSLFLLAKRGLEGFVWFALYFTIVVLVDVVSNYLPLSQNGNNQWRFNLYLPVQNAFFAYLFFQHFRDWTWRNFVWIAVGIFWLVYLLDITLLIGFWSINANAVVVTCIEWILFANLYYLQAVRSDSFETVFKDPMFYVSTACLVFATTYGVFFAAFFYYETSAEAYREHQFLYRFIGNNVNSIHYALLMLALLVYRPLRHV